MQSNNMGKVDLQFYNKEDVQVFIGPTLRQSRVVIKGKEIPVTKISVSISELDSFGPKIQIEVLGAIQKIETGKNQGINIKILNPDGEDIEVEDE